MSEYLINMPERHLLPFQNEHAKWGDAYKSIRDFSCKHTGFIVMLCGIRGSGKTKMAVSVAKLYAKNEMKSAYYKAIEIFMAIRGTYGGSDLNETEVVKKFIIPSLLIIDEAHERGNSEWEDRMLTYIIDKRYDSLRDTLLISNQKPDECIKSVGQSIASRILETGAIMECNWNSFRVKTNRKR